MNHLGDTNKMVSDTPRTDSLLTAILDSDGFVHNGNCPQRWVNHARELERELNAANAKIKRLEEAGGRMADVLTWSAAIQYKRSPTVAAWRKAKEDKP